MLCDLHGGRDLVSVRVNQRRPESNDDIQEKDEIDDCVDVWEKNGIHKLRRKGYFERDGGTIEQGR